ncbi:MAG TPA: shikimate kinase [Clostridia bacterium]|nr:shikimate kinase [Clostridia bacterium]
MSAQPTHIFLVGFMGAGKTSVGRQLAVLLGWDFIDLDAEVERLERRSVAEIFAAGGEEHFRRLERTQLERVCRELAAPTVVALGGGAFIDLRNAERVTALGTTVFLDAPLPELRARIARVSGVRPLAKDEERFQRLYAERRSAYEKAKIRVNTGGRSAPDVAREIAGLVTAGHRRSN